jgi:hypothetical protein
MDILPGIPATAAIPAFTVLFFPLLADKTIHYPGIVYCTDSLVQFNTKKIFYVRLQINVNAYTRVPIDLQELYP